jgi:uncharacterized membrane protein
MDACQAMDDPAGQGLGYTPAEYAFVMMSAYFDAVDASADDRNRDAARVVYYAAHDLCPKHIADLPASWSNGVR